MAHRGVAHYLRRAREGDRDDDFCNVPSTYHSPRFQENIRLVQSYWPPINFEMTTAKREDHPVVRDFVGTGGEKRSKIDRDIAEPADAMESYSNQNRAITECRDDSVDSSSVSNSGSDTDSDSSFYFTFFDLPREIRDMIYSELHHIQGRFENCMVAEPLRLAAIQVDNSLPTLARYFRSAICQTNKQLAAEYTQQILKTECIYIRSGPLVLHNFFRLLDTMHMSWIKNIEMDWLTMPRDFHCQLREAENREIWPLFNFIRTHSNIKSITFPLHFLEAPGAIRRPQMRYTSETLVFHQSKYEVLRYWRIVGAYAIGLLLHGALDEVLIRVRPYDIWTLLDPVLKVRDLANVPWKDWIIGDIDLLDDLEHQLYTRGHHEIDILTLIVDVKVQTWLDENIGEEILITMRKPSVMSEQKEQEIV